MLQVRRENGRVELRDGVGEESLLLIRADGIEAAEGQTYEARIRRVLGELVANLLG